MVRKNGAEIARQRMEEMAKVIQKGLQKWDELSLSKTVASFRYKFGLTKDRIMEYLSVLEDLQQFVLDYEGDKIRRTSESAEV